MGDTSIALSTIADDNAFVEVKAAYAKEMVTGFMKLNGVTVGAVANRSEVYNEEGGKAETFDAALSPAGCEKAAEFISDEEGKEVVTAQDAIAGALDIIAEQISDVADYRTYIRDITMKEGKLVVTAKDEKAESVYENYYDYSEALSTIPGHRILAINRGEDEKFLTVKVEAPEERILRYLEKNILKDNAFTTDAPTP